MSLYNKENCFIKLNLYTPTFQEIRLKFDILLQENNLSGSIDEDKNFIDSKEKYAKKILNGKVSILFNNNLKIIYIFF